MVKLRGPKFLLQPNDYEAAGFVKGANVWRANCLDVKKQQIQTVIDVCIVENDFASLKNEFETVVWPRTARNATSTIRIGRPDQPLTEHADVSLMTLPSPRRTPTSITNNGLPPSATSSNVAAQEDFRVVEAKIDINLSDSSSSESWSAVETQIRRFFDSLASRLRKQGLCGLFVVFS